MERLNMILMNELGGFLYSYDQRIGILMPKLESQVVFNIRPRIPSIALTDFEWFRRDLIRGNTWLKSFIE